MTPKNLRERDSLIRDKSASRETVALASHLASRGELSDHGPDGGLDGAARGGLQHGHVTADL